MTSHIDNEVTTDLRARYERAQALEQGSGTKKMVFNTTLYPNWIADTDHFWYQRHSRKGYEYRLVNAKNNNNEIAFDHQILAKVLSDVVAQEVDVENLPLENLKITLSPRTVSFDAFGRRWSYSFGSHNCKEVHYLPKEYKVSPDGSVAIFIKDYNLWLRDLKSGSEKPLTTDGERFYNYASTTTVYGRHEIPLTLEALWSPDSKRVFTQLIDSRKLQKAPPLVDHVPADGSLRPRMINPERRVAWPEDEHIEAWQFLAIDIEADRIQSADYPPCPVYYPHYRGFFEGFRGWWGEDSRRAYFTEVERGGKTCRLVEFDTHTGNTSVVIEETSDSLINLIPYASHVSTLVLPLPETNELIWYSYRSGWAHFYLYDLNTKALKNPITQGEWMARNLLHFDAQQRQLYIQTAGRETGRNPYYRDICRVNIDTGELTELLSSDHDYLVCDGRSNPGVEHMGVSPTSRYLVTTRSRVDEVPVSFLLDTNKIETFKLETADISGLPDNWQWPEPVMLKAADGEVDIYGVVFRPSDFSPEKSYPVLDNSYFFASPVGSFTNNALFDWSYMASAAYAELGMVVVMIFSRGNDCLRHAAFNNYQDPRFPINQGFVMYNKVDCVAGIKQLAERYSYMDLDRIGITDMNTLPTALYGLLVYPEFYKVGVSRNAMINWRMMGALAMEGGSWPELENVADKLKGKLFLVASMLDTMVPVSMTFRMIERLQKANKDFDLLLLPNGGHLVSSYALRRTWDYLVLHLLGESPPQEFELEIDRYDHHRNTDYLKNDS